MPENGAALRLLIVAETVEQRQWIGGVDFAKHRMERMVLYAPGLAALELPTGAAAYSIPEEVTSTGRVVPSFRTIVGVLEESGQDAILLLSNSAFSAMVRTAADLLAIPVFSFVNSSEDLANIVRRAKTRPDLFFITDAQLFPAALENPAYGRTLFPTGPPIQSPGSPSIDPGIETDHRYGDAHNLLRLLENLERWWDGKLEILAPELSIIVPAYKESKNLSLVTTRLLEMLDRSEIRGEILLVDDASPDDTYAMALAQMWRSPRVRALTKKPPRGMGNAIRHGIGYANAPILAVTMGDGSDEVSRMPEMFDKIRSEGYGLSIGCRYRVKENYETVPLLYRFWSRCFRFTTWLLLGLHLKDYTNAFRMFHRRIFERYGAESGGFEISPEITFKAWFATRRVAEVDVRHLKRASGQSNFSFLRAGPGYGKILIKAFVNRLTGRWFTLDW